MVRTGRGRVAQRPDQQDREVHRLEDDRPPGVQAGQQQQVLHQPGHPDRLRLDPVQRVRHVVGDRLMAAPTQLGIAPDRGERRAQLVAGVGDEPPDPGLAGLPGRQRLGDVAEHGVQRRADLADLGAPIGVGVGHPDAEGHLAAVQGHRRDLVCGGRDPAQRTQRQPHDRRADHRAHGHEHHGDQRDDRGQPERRVLHALHRQAGHDHCAAAEGHRTQAVLPEVAAEVTGVVRGVRGHGAEHRGVARDSAGLAGGRQHTNVTGELAVGQDGVDRSLDLPGAEPVAALAAGRVLLDLV